MKYLIFKDEIIYNKEWLVDNYGIKWNWIYPYQTRLLRKKIEKDGWTVKLMPTEHMVLLKEAEETYEATIYYLEESKAQNTDYENYGYPDDEYDYDFDAYMQDRADSSLRDYEDLKQI